MRSPLVLAAVLALTGCTADTPAPTSVSTPGGPCATTRDQPPESSQEQRLQGDLDGDGRSDEVVSWVRDGTRVAQAWLATGENAEPQPLFSGKLLAVGDVDGDRRAEVFAERTATTVGVFVLKGCGFAPLALGDEPWEVARADGPLLCRGGGVLEQLRRPRGEQESAQGTLVAQRFRVAQGAVTDLGPTITKTDIRVDDLERADAPVLCSL